MRASLLAELSKVFEKDAMKLDKQGKHDDADHLWDVAGELHEKAKKKHHDEALRLHE